jgi:hypothetical protein
MAEGCRQVAAYSGGSARRPELGLKLRPGVPGVWGAKKWRPACKEATPRGWHRMLAPRTRI